MSVESTEMKIHDKEIDLSRDRFPYSIVWTPLPCITWLIPPIGHMGIAYSTGIIRDFAGPYFVSEDNLAFGKTTRYLQLDPTKIKGREWDAAVHEASEEYKKRMHNICCDNCHSHVAMALNLMEYEGRTNWNMINLCFYILFKGKFVNFSGFLKTWAPLLFIIGIILVIALVPKY
jgi:hypothetical protein